MVTYRQGMIDEVRVRLLQDVNLVNITADEFENTVAAEARAEWRQRFQNPTDNYEMEILKHLGEYFGDVDEIVDDSEPEEGKVIEQEPEFDFGDFEFNPSVLPEFDGPAE
jgi:hypothetical protein